MIPRDQWVFNKSSTAFTLRCETTILVRRRPLSQLGPIVTQSHNTQTARNFMQQAAQFGYQEGPQMQSVDLTNFTFFAGAGFSKSWDNNAPVGSDLFTLNTHVIETIADVGALSRMFGITGLSEITPEQLRQIVYQIDMYERYPDVRPRYVDMQNIDMFRGALRAAVVDRYDSLADLNYFDADQNKFLVSDPSQAQHDIVSFFRELQDRVDGSQGPAEGLRTHFITTNYDYVIETILDNVVAPDDSLFLYTYRGVTPRRIAGQDNISPVHEHWLVQHLLKINGGFEVLRRGDGYEFDYSQRTPEAVTQDPPVLMLASREQDYTDPYFQTIFPKVVRLMRETTVLVIVGYSLPEDDALIRFFLRQFAEEPEDGRNKTIYYIGPGTDLEKRSVVQEVFPWLDQPNAPTLFTYNAGFDCFAAECLAAVETT